MKVLEVHEDMLERGGGETGLPGEDLGDGEKALVREMCNVSVSFLSVCSLGFFLPEKVMLIVCVQRSAIQCKWPIMRDMWGRMCITLQNAS